MDFLKNVPVFNWKTFGFLLDAKGAGAHDSVLQFFLDWSWEIAFLLGMVAFACAIIKSMSGQNTNILPIVLKLILAIILISNYEPICKTAINFFDDVSSVIAKGEYKRDEFVGMANNMKSDRDLMFQMFYGEDEADREQAKVDYETKHSYDPYRISLWNFNLLHVLGALILALSQIVIYLISKFRDVTIAFLLLIGRLCIVGIVWDKSEGLLKGWLMSFLNVLSWSLWLSIIVYFQAKIAFAQSDLVNADPKIMMESIATLIVFFFLYLQVFSLGKELYSGNFGTAAASIGTMVTAGLAGKVLMEGAKKGLNKLGGIQSPGLIIDEIDGLSKMDPSAHPVQVNDSLSPASPQAQIGTQNYEALPAPPQTDFYGDENGSVMNTEGSNKFDYGGPVIDAEYTTRDD